MAKKKKKQSLNLKDKGDITVNVPNNKRMEIIKTLAESIKTLCDAVSRNSIEIKIQNNTARSISIGHMNDDYDSDPGLIGISNCVVDGNLN